ncbi:MAG: hypothetical protein WBM77_07365 [Maribacter sp.]
MSTNKQQIAVQLSKQLSIIALVVLAVFILLSILNDHIFLDRLLPATGIISLVLLIRNLGERS